MRLSQYIYKTAEERFIPISCQWEITRKCNLVCQHCYAEPLKRDELTLERQLEIVDEIWQLGTFSIAFTGGDPFTLPYLFQIIEKIRRRRMEVSILTNGNLIDEQKAKVLAVLGVSSISLSIYGSNPDIHDFVTMIKGSFEKTINSAILCRKFGLNVRLKFIIMKHNLNDIDNMIKMAQGLDFKYSMDFTITPKDDGDTKPLQFMIDKDNYRKVYEKVYDSNQLIKYRKNIEKMNGKRDFRCQAGITYFFINAYGDVFPCVEFQVVCGNLNTDSLKDIWTRASFLLKLRNIKPDDLTECNLCRWKFFCGRCYGLALRFDKNPFGKSTVNCKKAEILSDMISEITV